MRRVTGRRTSGVGPSQFDPEVGIIGADQKERGLCGRECEQLGGCRVACTCTNICLPHYRLLLLNVPFSHLVDRTERNALQAAKSWIVVTARHVLSGEHEVIVIPLLVQSRALKRNQIQRLYSDRLTLNPATPHRDLGSLALWGGKMRDPGDEVGREE